MTLPVMIINDPDDPSVLTSAMVNWWLRHPDHTAEEMTRPSERILGAIIGSSRIETEIH